MDLSEIKSEKINRYDFKRTKKLISKEPIGYWIQYEFFKDILLETFADVKSIC